LIAEEAWRGGIAKVLKFSQIEEAVKALRGLAHAAISFS